MTLRSLCLVGALLLAAGARGANATALHEAARAGDLALLESQIATASDIEALDERGDTPLIAASLAGRDEVVARLLDAGARIDGRSDRGMTALHAAAYGGHLEVAQLLIERGAAVDDQANKFGITPLHAASEENHLTLVELLVAIGAQVDLVEVNGYTALTRAGYKEHWDVVALLRKNGAQCQPREAVGDWLYDHCVKFPP
jgi:ankyrin repeat protein